MAYLGLVDNHSFLKNMYLEIMSTDEKYDNYYYLIRKENRLYFKGNSNRIYEFTEVTDDTQLKEYYDRLYSSFNNDITELVSYDDSGAILIAIIKDKIICVASDNEFDDWIFKRKYIQKYFRKKTNK